MTWLHNNLVSRFLSPFKLTFFQFLFCIHFCKSGKILIFDYFKFLMIHFFEYQCKEKSFIETKMPFVYSVCRLPRTHTTTHVRHRIYRCRHFSFYVEQYTIRKYKFNFNWKPFNLTVRVCASVCLSVSFLSFIRSTILAYFDSIWATWSEYVCDVCCDSTFCVVVISLNTLINTWLYRSVWEAQSTVGVFSHRQTWKEKRRRTGNLKYFGRNIFTIS